MNKKKKQAYKISNNKNKRIYLLIAILILLLFQFIALGLSRAQKIIEVEVFFNDTEEIVKQQSVILNAINSGDSGSFIILPETINNIYVNEYHITENMIDNSGDKYEIEKNENENENEKNEKEDDNLNYEILLAGEKLYLSTSELESREIEVDIVYNSKENIIDGKKEKVYYQEIYEDDYTETEEHLANIILKGYMPLNLNFEASTEIKADIQTLLDENKEENFDINRIIKLGFKLEDEKYIFENTEENIIIKFEPVDIDRIYKVYSFNTKKEYIGKTNVKDALGNNINIFETNEIESFTANTEELTLNVDNINEIEYLGIVSRKSEFTMMKSPLNEGGIVMMGMEVPLGFDLSTGTDIWDGSTSTSFIGNGQVNNPYLITSGADLAYLRNRVNSGTTFENNYFQLTNNIDLDNREWEPIGEYNRPFRGNLDGAGRVIKNAIIIASGSIPSNSNGNVISFGFFGSIGGGTNANNRQVIENLELDNIVIESRFSGSTVTGTTDRMFGINLGTLAGTMFQNSTVSNVNIRNMDIHHTGYSMTIRTYRFQYLIGGLVGETIRLPNTIGDPGANLRYSIDNVVVDGNISMNSVTINNRYVNSAQYSTGGIIGRIRSQPVWPENSLFRGNIYSANSHIGPIFAQLRNTTNVNNTINFDNLWQGNDAGNLTCTSSYNSFAAYGTSFTNTVISGTSSARRSTTNNNIGYVQGVNKGIYNNNNNNILTSLNQSSKSNNVKWQYSAQNGFELRPRLRIEINESPENTYSIQVNDSYYSASPYTHQWIFNDVVSSNTTTVFVQTEPSFDEDLNVIVRTRDSDGYYSTYKFIIPRLYVEITFNINQNQKTVEATLSGPGFYLTSYSDYTFQWYKEDISGFEDEEIVGATSRFLTGLDARYDYKLIATNNAIPQLSCEDGFEFAERTVIYVSSSGNNNNNGFTPTTPVRDFANAYSKLPTSGSRDTNIIVVMNSITGNALFTGVNTTTYRRDVTITGAYKKTTYNALITLHGATTYKYMNGDTTFMYLTLDGANNQIYWYLQGFSLTIGEQVSMTRYPTANTNQGLITGNAPGFHILGSWERYNMSSLPRNNPEILIKSGTFGRIILGGSPGTNAVANLQNTTSRNFIGSANDMYNITVTIDIQNSTTPSTYAYDINLLVGGSAAGNNYSNVVQNIKSGKVGRILGGAIGDSSVRPNGWSYPINTFMGTVEINISGGEVVELYGGSLGRNMSALTGGSSVMCDSYFYGIVEINISGGIITGDIYGAGAGRCFWLPCKLLRPI